VHTIFKYPVKISGMSWHLQTIDLPVGAEPLSFHLQNGQPCLWAMVDPDAPTAPRIFLVAGTGGPICQDPLSLLFVGSVLMHDDALVWHLFEVFPENEKLVGGTE